MNTVLVTGGSGFIATHVVAQLLAAGHAVKATLRSAGRESDVRETLSSLRVDTARLTFAVADLSADAGWAAAVDGCDFVIHTASPFPASVPRHEDELVVPARDGTLRVLRAAAAAGVRRVVLTSSFAAIGYGHHGRTTPYDERDWSDISGTTSAYVKSKTLAERAAWDFVARPGTSLELSVINPVVVLGPVSGADYSTSILLLDRMLRGKLPGLPKLIFGVVDVRDVADLHLRAMTHPAASGERFLCAAGDFLSLRQIATVLKSRLGAAAARVSTRELPDRLVRLVAVGNVAARQALPELGKWKNGSSSKATQTLGWRPRSSDEAIVATAESLLALGLLR